MMGAIQNSVRMWQLLGASPTVTCLRDLYATLHPERLHSCRLAKKVLYLKHFQRAQPCAELLGMADALQIQHATLTSGEA